MLRDVWFPGLGLPFGACGKESPVQEVGDVGGMGVHVQSSGRLLVGVKAGGKGADVGGELQEPDVEGMGGATGAADSGGGLNGDPNGGVVLDS